MIELLLIILTGLFDTELQQASQETGLNLTLVMNEDQSVSLMADNDTKLAGFTNVPTLYGPNGIEDILQKIPTWNLTK